MRVLAAGTLVLLLCACSTRETVNSKEARVRNQPPATCTQGDFERCPAIAPIGCEPGQEQVIDYSSDCCPIVSCQPLCEPTAPCAGWPAPSCPPGTALQILTAADCCPAYRCEPNAQCDEPVACPMSFPYCGEGVDPIEIGTSADCCPIYQCPCDPVPVPAGGENGTEPGYPGGGDDVPVTDPPYCGCTFPVCAPGFQLECYGSNPCGTPCECVPVASNCMSDADCGPNMFCDTSQCLPMPGCDPESGMACPAVCGGICVGYVQNGCAADSECPAGQRCDLQCMGWGCSPAGPPTCACPEGDPTCECPPPGDPTGPGCACPAGDPTCTCNPDGTCGGETCYGLCVPVIVCEPGAGEPCPDLPPDCVPGPIDPTTCCPIATCSTTCTPLGMPCAMPNCEGAVPIGTDQNCCPIFCCPGIDPGCPEPTPL